MNGTYLLLIVVELDNDMPLWHNEIVLATKNALSLLIISHSYIIKNIFYLSANGFSLNHFH